MKLYLCHVGSDAKAYLERIKHLSTPDRLKKAGRLPKEKQAISLAAGLLGRYTLRQDGAALPKFWQDESGKPVASCRHISLSHSGEYCACAVSHHPVGIDIQHIRPISDRVAERVFTSNEQKAVSRCKRPCEHQCILWALKESYFKASGQAGFPFGGSEFKLSDGRAKGPSGWSFWFWLYPKGYVTALCTKDDSCL